MDTKALDEASTALFKEDDNWTQDDFNEMKKQYKGEGSIVITRVKDREADEVGSMIRGN